MAIDVFISYTHADRALRDELAKHLSGLRNQGVINDWFDGDIVEGTEWEPQIISRLDTAQVILLLISSDFLASKFCYHTEMKRALARHETHEARVIPIILRPSDWHTAPFGKLKALPTDGKAVTSWPTYDDAFLDVVKGIKRALRDLQAGNSLPAQKQPGGDDAPSVSPPASDSAHIVRNQIGSIGGKNHSIIQAGTQHTTTNNYYGFPNAIRRGSSPTRKGIKNREGC